MIRRILFALFMAGAAIAACAQDAATKTVIGMVVDKNGNPLVGAEVRAPKGSATAYTEADGSFKIEMPAKFNSLTASYSGLADRKMKTRPGENPIFTLKNKKNNHGFIAFTGGAQGVLGSKVPVHGMVPQLGLMGGFYRTLGMYIRLSTGFAGPRFNESMEDKHFPELVSFNIGLIRKVNADWNVFLGIGAASSNHVVRYTAGSYGDYGMQETTYSDPESDTGFAIEAGCMYHWKKLFGVAGIYYVTPGSIDDYSYGFEELDNNYSGNLGFFLGVGLHF